MVDSQDTILLIPLPVEQRYVRMRVWNTLIDILGEEDSKKSLTITDQLLGFIRKPLPAFTLILIEEIMLGLLKGMSKSFELTHLILSGAT